MFIRHNAAAGSWLILHQPVDPSDEPILLRLETACAGISEGGGAGDYSCGHVHHRAGHTSAAGFGISHRGTDMPAPRITPVGGYDAAPRAEITPGQLTVESPKLMVVDPCAGYSAADNAGSTGWRLPMRAGQRLTLKRPQHGCGYLAVVVALMFRRYGSAPDPAGMAGWPFTEGWPDSDSVLKRDLWKR